MNQATICPFCDRPFPLKNQLCLCGAYRVNEENYNLSLKERNDLKELKLYNKVVKNGREKRIKNKDISIFTSKFN